MGSFTDPMVNARYGGGTSWFYLKPTAHRGFLLPIESLGLFKQCLVKEVSVSSPKMLWVFF